ncbi:hypothetical protein ABD67_21930 [Bacillus sonorensis]|uniref:Uncharacterized protein n=1 Tax=Bacillus sonorensis TaxID=119858 RepID=A0ABN5ANJ5_9BACI|nr:hypothetical protein S101395_04691 [Bacillus sonorensis]MBG9917463.1 hypothetical protein [Bacillus sonorensis]
MQAVRVRTEAAGQGLFDKTIEKMWLRLSEAAASAYLRMETLYCSRFNQGRHGFSCTQPLNSCILNVRYIFSPQNEKHFLCLVAKDYKKIFIYMKLSFGVARIYS